MKRTLTILLVVVLVGGVAAAGYLRFGGQRASAAPASNLPTATVQKGTLTATVNTAGNITAHSQVALNFGQTGVVKQVMVQVGDQVKAGQVLAQLDDSDLQLQLKNAQANLKVAQDKLAQAKNPSTAQDIANARAAVDAAQANYNKTTAGAAQTDIAAAQASVASAQAAYAAAVKSAGTSNSQLSAAAAAVEKAQAALQAAQSAYDKVANQPNVGMLSQSVTLQQATIDYNTAKANYDSLAATTNTDAASKVQSARAQLEQAQASLAKLQNQVNQNDVTASQAQVTQAKNNLDKLLAGADANSLDIAQNSVDQADIALQQAQLKVQQAQIVAPFGGVVTAINITPGQNAPTAATGAIQISDLGHLEIISNLSEVDISRLQVGQNAQVTLDALPNANLVGKVTAIAPAGVLSQGVVNYPVTVALTNPDPAVKTGMTANVSVVVEQKNDVLTVPNRAIRTQGRQKLVTVLFEGQQMQVPVTTGMSSDTATEIMGGLKEGDTVVLNTTTTTAGGGLGGGARIGVGGFGPVGGR